MGVARARERTIEELLLYDLSVTSYLPEGLITKPDKSAFVQELETELKKMTRKSQDSELQTACLVDVLASALKIKRKDLNTFSNFCVSMLYYATGNGQGAERMDLVLNSYVERSTCIMTQREGVVKLRHQLKRMTSAVTRHY